MSAELIAAAAVVIGAAIGVGGALLGAHVNSRHQRELARAERAAAQREDQRNVCAGFLANLDIYLMTADEMAWAKPGARRAGSDAKQATSELKDHYWSAWTALLSANSAVQLAVALDVRQQAKRITSSAYDVDAWIWNLTHGGERIAGEYGTSRDELLRQREEFIALVSGREMQLTGTPD
ncbi:hypothetical protein [Salinispora oceanensis]|uniref:hypothetical protein n=1 Tax=Salinispora oceanensis TaxID=1050199 RepID=UPI001CC4FDEF|nr:hypothetical protein [Salinispora oceanensis]